MDAWGVFVGEKNALMKLAWLLIMKHSYGVFEVQTGVIWKTSSWHNVVLNHFGRLNCLADMDQWLSHNNPYMGRMDGLFCLIVKALKRLDPKPAGKHADGLDPCDRLSHWIPFRKPVSP